MSSCIVWVLRTKNICLERDIPAFARYLNVREEATAQSFSTQTLSETYRVSRGFTKWALAQSVTKGDVGAIDIQQDKGGKPYLVSSRDKWQFNVSHCPEMVVVACAGDQTVGVDIERIDPNVDLSIADTYFCETEKAQIRQAPVAQQAERFFEFWTLKEAYLKARGVGLSGGLHAISFGLQHLPGLSYRCVDDDDDWWFDLYHMEDCKLALCRRGYGGEVRFLEWREGKAQQILPHKLGESLRK